MSLKSQTNKLSLIARWWIQQNKQAGELWASLPLIIVVVFAASVATYIVLNLIAHQTV